jgi:hypothetical protein
MSSHSIDKETLEGFVRGDMRPSAKSTIKRLK